MSCPMTVCEWHCTLPKGSLMTLCPMTNRWWMSLYIFLIGSLITPSWYLIVCGWCYTFFWLAASQCWQTGGEWHPSFWKAVSANLILWQTVCEWHCTSCNATSSHIIPWTTESGWHFAYYMKYSLTTSCHANRKQVTSYTFLNGNLITSCTMTSACQWNCTFIWMQSHNILPYGKQFVSNTTHCSERQPYCTLSMTIELQFVSAL